jgi:hypothetical protein
VALTQNTRLIIVATNANSKRGSKLHITTARLKNGQVVEGVLTFFRPTDGYLMIYGQRINLNEAQSITTEGDRPAYGKVENVDEIERARCYMKDARANGWEGMTPATPLQDWE